MITNQKDSNMKSYIILLLTVFTLSGCIVKTNKVNEVYAGPSENIEFDGIVDVIEETNKDIRIVFIHGMGGYSSTGGISDYSRVIKDLRSALKIKSSYNDDSLDSFSYKGQTLKFNVLWWLDITSQAKIKLRNIDDDPVLNSNRTETTKLAKDRLLNDGIVDVVMYTGSSKKQIIKRVRNQVLDLKKQIDENEKLIVVTFSLGSKILIDVLSELKADGGHVLDNRVDMIYMMANQIALLNTGDLVNKAPKTLSEKMASDYDVLHSILDDGTIDARNANPKKRVIAFSDPNDLLSYPIDESSVGELKGQYANVAISVAKKTYKVPVPGVYKYGVVNYLQAHTGYVHDEVVSDYLLFGTSK
ncbi:hypothetical protein BM527_10835 [Alteromonas sp. Mex14]|nr:hypothetical protein BM527_10835 [Alteromonas sp. Mex14]